jgi:hypothetical protein
MFVTIPFSARAYHAESPLWEVRRLRWFSKAQPFAKVESYAAKALDELPSDEQAGAFVFLQDTPRGIVVCCQIPLDAADAEASSRPAAARASRTVKRLSRRDAAMAAGRATHSVWDLGRPLSRRAFADR